MSNVIVFDLDDTLYKEIDFVYSGFMAVAESIGVSNDFTEMVVRYHKGENVFAWLCGMNKNVCVDSLLNVYREHKPSIELKEDIADMIRLFRDGGNVIGVITDGRSSTQRNKLEALKLDIDEEHLVISEEIGSEKPNAKNYMPFQKHKGKKYYIGDNVSKDFIVPNELGWTTICLLDDGKNIHTQNFNDFPEGHHPKIIISKLTELEKIIL